MKCGHKIIIDSEDTRFRFAGGALKKYEGFAKNDVWVEIPCELEDGHVGHHQCWILKDPKTGLVEWYARSGDGSVWLA
jgi:hypothetical protein